MTVALAAVIGGLVIVLLAVGIPYWLTHRRMSAQDDRAESAAYLEATGRTAEDVAAGRSCCSRLSRSPRAAGGQTARQCGVHSRRA